MWSGRYTHHCESWNNYKGLDSNMWSLLDEFPKTHNVATFGKLDYRSGGHTIQARVSSWLGAAGIDKPSYRFDPCQQFEVVNNINPRCHEQDWDRLNKAWRYGFDDETVRTVRRIYFAMCAEADALVGAVYDAMERLGLAHNTYFVFSSDHGQLFYRVQSRRR